MQPTLKLRLLAATSRAAKARAADAIGITLIELLVVVIIIGIVAGIAAPGWLAFVQRHRLNKSRSEVYQALMAAKSNATRDKLTWQFSLREKNNFVQWAIHPASGSEFIPATVLNNEAYWNNLERGVRIDKEKNDRGKYETSEGFKDKNSETWRVLFNYFGCPIDEPDHDCGTVGALGRISFQLESGGKLKRCIIFSTVLGAMRLAQERPKPNDDKYCY